MDYSGYDGVSNAERAAHLALATMGVETVHSRAVRPRHGGFALYWPARWRGDMPRARATIGCDWRAWLPERIRTSLAEYERAEFPWVQHAGDHLNLQEPRDKQAPYRDAIVAWARETHPALFAGATA